MKKLLLVFFTCLSFSAAAETDLMKVKEAIPVKEGEVIAVAELGSMFRNRSTLSAYDALLTCNLFSCQAVAGNLAVTKDSLLFVTEGRVVLKIPRADIESFYTEKFGKSRFLFITNKNYDTTAFSFSGQEAVQPILNIFGIAWVDN